MGGWQGGVAGRVRLNEHIVHCWTQSKNPGEYGVVTVQRVSSVQKIFVHFFPSGEWLFFVLLVGGWLL